MSELLRSRQRRRIKRKMGAKYGRFIKKLIDLCSTFQVTCVNEQC